MHIDVLDDRLDLLRCRLAGDRPAGCLGGRAQGLPEFGSVDLEYQPIDLVRKRVAVAQAFVSELEQLAHAMQPPPVLVDLETKPSQRIQRFPMRGQRIQAVHKQHVSKEIQSPLSSHGGVKHPKGARGGVARIGEQRLVCLAPVCVQFRKGSPRHNHFAADFKLRWQTELAERRRIERQG